MIKNDIKLYQKTEFDGKFDIVLQILRSTFHRGNWKSMFLIVAFKKFALKVDMVSDSFLNQIPSLPEML